MTIVTVLGARPQFVKAAPVSHVLREAGHRELLVHTGQHYDHGLSRVFFEELELPEPYVDLAVGSGSHARQTAEMLTGVGRVLEDTGADLVLVYGDTNSTLAGALAAAKLGIPLAHVEAGLRSFNRTMPEEHNRVLTDHCADLLFCPTETAAANLVAEGISTGVHLVGDTMYDAVLRYAPAARARSTILSRLALSPGAYHLATVHRAYSTDDPGRLADLLEGLLALEVPVVLPIHPRTRARLETLGADLFRRLDGPPLRIIDPVGYLDMLMLEQNARVIVTDSGGVQKEACFFGVPCVTLRPETEWVETVAEGWNTVGVLTPESIGAAVRAAVPPGGSPSRSFGDGNAAGRIVHILEQALPPGRRRSE